ncbi:hypothetical protein SAMN04487944_12615 [Gracilibacillus ureilyticus]|uniref:Uncharacterized protein n=1 Tax=Gracilibacillus ureilyticus TaxID=531814 RepID=A0A1H9VQD5_9BACI|nr:hypothetical protein [Gracilibacillus ureilyticus]SES23789.1 hypothetical protein SAMN04487944_12615 [Gracilibacillus ureilyticus]
MTDNNKKQDSAEQNLKKKDPNRDIDPQREVDDTKKNESEKNPDDFN